MSIASEGIEFIKEVFTAQQCARYIDCIETIACKPDVHDFFRYDPDLLDLVCFPIIDARMRKLIDDDYVLIAGNAKNRSLSVGPPDARNHWHVDARTVGGRVLAQFSYEVIIMLDDFTPGNAATRYVPRSHLFGVSPPGFNTNSRRDVRTIEGKAGDVVIFDTALWHIGGVETEARRWSIFMQYGPWFMKPHFQFDRTMVNNERVKSSPLLQQLFHFDSTPPYNEFHGVSTLARIRALEKQP